jgi:hypothetical protein
MIKNYDKGTKMWYFKIEKLILQNNKNRGIKTAIRPKYFIKLLC